MRVRSLDCHALIYFTKHASLGGSRSENIHAHCAELNCSDLLFIHSNVTKSEANSVWGDENGLDPKIPCGVARVK